MSFLDTAESNDEAPSQQGAPAAAPRKSFLEDAEPNDEALSNPFAATRQPVHVGTENPGFGYDPSKVENTAATGAYRAMGGRAIDSINGALQDAGGGNYSAAAMKMAPLAIGAAMMTNPVTQAGLAGYGVASGIQNLAGIAGADSPVQPGPRMRASGKWGDVGGDNAADITENALGVGGSALMGMNAFSKAPNVDLGDMLSNAISPMKRAAAEGLRGGFLKSARNALADRLDPAAQPALPEPPSAPGESARPLHTRTRTSSWNVDPMSNAPLPQPHTTVDANPRVRLGVSIKPAAAPEELTPSVPNVSQEVGDQLPGIKARNGQPLSPANMKELSRKLGRANPAEVTPAPQDTPAESGPISREQFIQLLDKLGTGPNQSQPQMNGTPMNAQAQYLKLVQSHLDGGLSSDQLYSKLQPLHKAGTTYSDLPWRVRDIATSTGKPVPGYNLPEWLHGKQ